MSAFLNSPSQIINPLARQRRFGFGSGVGQIGFVGALDSLVSQGATIVAAYSVRRLLGSYTGAALRLRGNGTGSPEADIPYLANGDLDTTAASAAASAAGGTAAFFRTWYEQSANARNASQSTAASQPQYAAGSHAKGAALGNGASQRLDTASFSLTQPFTVFAIVRRAAGAGSSAVFGDITGGGINNTIYDSNPNWQAFYGSFLSGAAADPPDNIWSSLTARINGSSSSLQMNDGALVNGNAGTQTPTGIRLMGRPDGALGWNGFASEFIVFSGDPTGLAGWSTFKNNAYSYFGI